jgi:hypothetical protein
MSEHGPQIPTNDLDGVVKMTYCPGRDFINIYPTMLYNLARQFDLGYWDELIKSANLNDDFIEAKNQISDILAVVNKFIELSCADENEKFNDVLRKAGWFDIPEAARQVFMAMLGHLMLGQLFAGIRDVSYAGEVPPRHWRLCLEKFWNLAAESARPKLSLWQRLSIAVSFILR